MISARSSAVVAWWLLSAQTPAISSGRDKKSVGSGLSIGRDLPRLSVLKIDCVIVVSLLTLVIERVVFVARFIALDF